MSNLSPCLEKSLKTEYNPLQEKVSATGTFIHNLQRRKTLMLTKNVQNSSKKLQTEHTQRR